MNIWICMPHNFELIGSVKCGRKQGWRTITSSSLLTWKQSINVYVSMALTPMIWRVGEYFHLLTFSPFSRQINYYGGGRREVDNVSDDAVFCLFFCSSKRTSCQASQVMFSSPPSFFFHFRHERRLSFTHHFSLETLLLFLWCEWELWSGERATCAPIHHMFGDRYDWE